MRLSQPEQPTQIRIFGEPRGRGHDGGYVAVRRYTGRGQRARSGDGCGLRTVELRPWRGQFDRSHEVVLLNGVTVIVKAAHVRLLPPPHPVYSRYPRETQEMVFDAHDRALALLKGIGQADGGFMRTLASRVCWPR